MDSFNIYPLLLIEIMPQKGKETRIVSDLRVGR
jgi:hypothetical protein